uniref:KIAA0586 n=1 Tax=Varanus komodoensis TaxID=61221 RepID=A0A8D2KR90_VARKO
MEASPVWCPPNALSCESRLGWLGEAGSCVGASGWRRLLYREAKTFHAAVMPDSFRAGETNLQAASAAGGRGQRRLVFRSSSNFNESLFLQVQNELEAKVSSVSEILSKLQETDKHLQRVAEQQANMKAQQLEQLPCHQRVGELEKQVNLFMGPRIQHLENLQQRQMDIQVSARAHKEPCSVAFIQLWPCWWERKGPSSLQQHPFSSTAAHAPGKNTQVLFSTLQKSPLRTPTPRRYAPVPVSKDAKMSQKMSGREQPIGEKENVHQSSCGGTAGEAWEGSKVLLLFIQPEPFKSTNPYINPIEKTVKKADDVLHELGQLKREMHNILQQISKSSILQSTKASKSILRDAEKILRTVRKNKKLLEENLEAIIRAKDGNALHSFIDELTADRDVLEEIRIRKTVDEWIKAISKEIQVCRLPLEKTLNQRTKKVASLYRLKPCGLAMYAYNILRNQNIWL